jgi:hypothetical protein
MGEGEGKRREGGWRLGFFIKARERERERGERGGWRLGFFIRARERERERGERGAGG